MRGRRTARHARPPTSRTVAAPRVKERVRKLVAAEVGARVSRRRCSPGTRAVTRKLQHRLSPPNLSEAGQRPRPAALPLQPWRHTIIPRLVTLLTQTRIVENRSRIDISASLHQDAAMRTTIDLPDELHDIVSSLASHSRRSLSQTAADLIRRGLSMQTGGTGPTAIEVDDRTGLPVVKSTRLITPDDVKAAEDDQ